ncbi:hypothetical protein LX36DRAFT_78899 [Colletotrichum falcatum]|nr:hypothetical protein LX36DRAFT_78899 [Colletotrichum falcatum]
MTPSGQERPSHHLSDRFIAKPGSGKWEMVQDEPAADRAARSLIQIQRQNGSGPPDITAEIHRLFNNDKTLPDNSEQTFVAKPPVYARVHYTPCDDDVGHTLEALQVIHIRDTGEEQDPIDDGVDRQLWRYVLVAAVRLRDRPDGHDKIRQALHHQRSRRCPNRQSALHRRRLARWRARPLVLPVVHPQRPPTEKAQSRTADGHLQRHDVSLSSGSRMENRFQARSLL